MNGIKTIPLNSQDEELVKVATSLIIRRAEYGRHHIACALRTTDGQQVMGLHVSANIGCGSICAEAAAIAELLKKGPAVIERIVAVRHKFTSENSIEIIPPCGQCLERILEHGPNALIIINISSQPVLIPITQLLPIPFHRRKRTEEVKKLGGDY